MGAGLAPIILPTPTPATPRRHSRHQRQLPVDLARLEQSVRLGGVGEGQHAVDGGIKLAAGEPGQ